MPDPVRPTELALALAALRGGEADADMDDRKSAAKGKLRAGAKPGKAKPGGYRAPAAWSRREGYDAPDGGGRDGGGR